MKRGQFLVTPGRIYTDCAALLYRYATPFIADNYQILVPVVKDLQEDLNAYIQRDPAAKADVSFVYETYLGFKAIMYYRVANAVLNISFTTANQKSEVERVSRIISEKGKLKTGVEIHPAASIASGFVIDHGFGTVIGETASIGNNVTILNNVILGARGIAFNASAKRHPTLNNNVQIGAGVKVFGPITIGEYSFIGPGIIIIHDVKPFTRYVLKSEILTKHDLLVDDKIANSKMP